MASYNGRTSGPNFSQFLNSLNTVQPPYEQDILSADDLNLDQELAMFTNADFTDFDALGGMPNHQAMNFDMRHEPNPNGSDIKYEELLSSDTAPFMSNFGAPVQVAPQQSTFHHSATLSPTSSSSSPQASSVKAGQKRKADADGSPFNVEDQTRLAAEEDKRRRNTAASARFRVKKKQREQALEKTVKEVNEKNASLQAKLEQLEMENKWLKNLITEKSGTSSEKEITDLYQKYRRDSEETDASRGSEHKDGVGTK